MGVFLYGIHLFSFSCVISLVVLSEAPFSRSSNLH